MLESRCFLVATNATSNPSTTTARALINYFMRPIYHMKMRFEPLLRRQLRRHRLNRPRRTSGDWKKMQQNYRIREELFSQHWQELRFRWVHYKCCSTNYVIMKNHMFDKLKANLKTKYLHDHQPIVSADVAFRVKFFNMTRSMRLPATASLNQYCIRLCISIWLNVLIWLALAGFGLMCFDLVRVGRSGLIWLDHFKSEQIDWRSFNFQKQLPTLSDFGMSWSQLSAFWHPCFQKAVVISLLLSFW